MSVIDLDNLFAFWAILFSLAMLGFWVDGHPKLRKSSGALWVLAGGVLLSNTNITPFEAPAYEFVFRYLLPLAIPLLLLNADLGRIFRESAGVMLTFLCASLSTVIAAIAALYCIDLGESGPHLAGVIASGYIGGTMNFVAVAQATGMEPDLFAVAIGANSVVSVIALMLLIAVPSVPGLRRFIPSQIMSTAEKPVAIESDVNAGTRFHLSHISLALCLSFTICALSYYLAEALAVEQYSILFVTAFTVVIASLAPNRLGKLVGAFEIGMLIMYLFFAAIGLSTNVTSFVDSAMNLFFYALLLVILHFALVLGFARLFRIDLAEAVIGSAAALVGPGPTAAIASSKGWHGLVTPGIMCGLFGYVIANFIGISIVNLLGQ